MLMPAFAAKSSKKGVTFTVNDAEQSSLRMMTARRVHHLLTSFTKTIYSSNSEKVQLLTLEPLPIFNCDGQDTILISPQAILYQPGSSTMGHKLELIWTYHSFIEMANLILDSDIVVVPWDWHRQCGMPHYQRRCSLLIMVQSNSTQPFSFSET